MLTTSTVSPRPLAAAVCALAAFAAPVLFAAPVAAQQQSSNGSSSFLDLTLHTGGSGASQATTRMVSAPAARPRTATRARTTSRSRLTSRGRAFTRQTVGGGPASDAQRAVGRLAVVENAQALIRRDANVASRVLSPVPQNTYLAITAEQTEFWGVRMIDGSTGWVSKADVRLVPFEVAVLDPNAPQAMPEPAQSGQPDLSGQVPVDVDARTAAMFREAFTYLGVPYVWGGNGRTGLDCSAFVRAVFATQGVNLPRVAADQARVGMSVAWADLKPGDRLYFDMGNKGRVSHTGLYLGQGMFIHASSNQRKVGIDPLSKPNYYNALVAIRRS